MFKRKEITETLTKAACDFWMDKKHAVHTEVFLDKTTNNRYRVDVVSVSFSDELFVSEIKSGINDFRTDNKWKNYLDRCNYMYFVITEEFYRSEVGREIRSEAKSAGCGILTYNPSDKWLKMRMKAKKRQVSNTIKYNVLHTMVMRYGNFARASGRTKIYIELTKKELVNIRHTTWLLISSIAICLYQHQILVLILLSVALIFTLKRYKLVAYTLQRVVRKLTTQLD